METTIAYNVDHDNLKNPSLTSNTDSHLVPLPSLSHSRLPTFLSHNGFNFPEIEISDIEMTTIKKMTYTSLKDLIPASPSTIMSPTHNSSWNEIPIKNPLVKQAALAYLQPMSTPIEVDKGFFGKLKDKYCSCGGIGCFGWFSIVFLRMFVDLFGDLCGRRRRRRRIDDGEDEDDDDDREEGEDEYDDKVD